MGKRSKGYRSKTRSLLRKKPRERGKINLSRLLHDYEINNKVLIDINPSVHKGMPHRRFHGKIGVVREKRGRSYVVEVKFGREIRKVAIRPEHLRPIQQ
ncbi:TPA: 50S ribosomal protein L21e [Candidatus Bathyarchaeota archaeon]|nr:50S ribosomal protein L21e [Candidatus Bathyarchaeota archaeon]